MGEKWHGKFVFRALLGLVAVAAVAGAVTMSAASGEPEADGETAAPRLEGGLKIVKTHPGLPNSDPRLGTTLFFRFDYTCTDGTVGQVIYPTDFNGANSQAEDALPLGTVCTVTESIVGDAAANWTVTSHVESQGGGFLPINPATVPINNATGNNVVQFKNEYDPIVTPGPGTLTVIKDFVGGSTPVTIGYVCGNSTGSFTFSADGQASVSIPAGTTCVLTETFDNGDAAAWTTSANGACALSTSVVVASAQTATATFVNTLVDYSVTSTCPPNG